MFDARRRSTAPELMDGPASEDELAACLHDLAQVNSVTLARAPTLGFLRRAWRRAVRVGRPGLRVLDVGCGEGDMLRRIRRWGERSGRRLELTGVDLNPAAVRAARRATPEAMRIAFRQADAFDPALGAELGGFDVIISSLVAHHMDDDGVVRFLQAMEARAEVGWLVNDLHRHAVAYHGFRALSGMAGWHRFVRHDGPVSVARAFTRGEWDALLGRAGLRGVAELRWRLPFRWCVTRLR